MKLRNGTLAIFCLAGLGAGLIAGCGDENPVALESHPTGCGDKTAMIGVYDSFLEVECGCQESSGTRGTPPAGVTCTVANGTILLFHFNDNNLRHQFVSTSGPESITTPLSDPGDGPKRVRIHSFTITKAGTYEFKDQFGPLKGTLIAH